MQEATGIEQAVLHQLRELGARYETVAIDPEFANTAAFCHRYGYSADESANCIVTVAKKGPRVYAANLVQATRRLDVNGRVRELMAVRKVSFAPAQETVEVTGMLPDGVTPFGLPPSVPIHVDAPIVEHERVVVGGGSRELKIVVDPEVFTRMPNVSIVDRLSRPAD